MALQQQKPDSKKYYNWVMTSDGKIACFKSNTNKQTVNKLWEVKELSAFHDAELARATSEINGILDRLSAANPDSNRQLGFIIVGNAPLLVWSEYGVIGSDDDPGTIERALGLKT